MRQAIRYNSRNMCGDVTVNSSENKQMRFSADEQET